MNRTLKSLVLSAAVAATTLLPVLEASAGQRWREHRPRHPEKHGSFSRDQQKADLIAAGLLGLAIGAIAVGAAGAAAHADPYDAGPFGADAFPEPPRGHYRAPRVIDAGDVAQGARFAGAMEPWSADWFEYCAARYRSFDGRTGTFMGYDGQRRFCNAN